MKTGISKGLSFGFTSVHAGQRNTSVEPQIIAISTEGSFRITPTVSSVLGVQHGEYLMFINNVANIDAAIRDKDAAILAFCEEAGLEVSSPEAYVAIHKEFDVWGIAKGIAEYDTKGNAKETQERLTKGDRLKFVSQNFTSMLEAAMEQGDDELQEALNRDGITKKEQMDILCPFVQAKTINKYKGSKVANPAGLSGAGTSLTFTDSNVWKQLKMDLGENSTKVNRVYDLDIDAIQTVAINNGYEMVNVKVLLLGDSADKEPARIGAKEEEDAE